MRVLHLECPCGLGGDMFLAALAGLGLDLAPLPGLLGPQVLSGITAVPEVRGGVSGLRLHLELAQGAPCRHLPQVLSLIDALDLSPRVRERSAAAFRRLAEVEAAVHALPVERVHFHEISAADTIVDVVGAFWGLEQLGVERVTCGPLPWFKGRIRCAHGELDLPAPATLRLLTGKPVYPTQYDKELITPTGALLLDQCVTEFGDGPQGLLAATSLAYGAMDLGGGLQALLLETEAGADGLLTERIWVLESNVDHLSGEDLGWCFEALFAAGAVDVLFVPGVMKKNRPAGVLQALCIPERLPAVQDAFFRSSLTLGLRRRLVERVCLPREACSLDSPWGPVPGKRVRYGEEQWSAPEYDALQTLARKTGLSPAALRRRLAGGEDAGS